MVASWPGTIPQSPLVDTWEEVPKNEMISSSVDSGEAPSRMRGTGIFWMCQGEFHFSNAAQYTAFWNFWINDLKKGSLPFTWNHPFTGVSYTWKLDPNAGPPNFRSLAQDKHRATLSFIRLP